MKQPRMTRMTRMGSAGLALLLSSLVASCTAEDAAQPVVLHGGAMGTTWQLTLHRLPAGVSEAALHAGVAGQIETIESQMSTWRADSPITRFNRSASTQPMPITAHLATVIAHAQQVSEQTGGAFDITVAPLVDLWGFGARPAAGERGEVPDDAAVAEARAHVGYALLQLVQSGEERTDGKAARDGATLAKSDPRVQIDLSALAKGYAIDVVAAYLDGLNVHDYLIELGGELRGRGSSPRGAAWTVGLEQPDPARVNRVRLRVPLSNRAIATSGNYRLFFPATSTGDAAGAPAGAASQNNAAAEGHRNVYSHIIDPRTGRPIGQQLVSVSVLASTAMHADALATALMVLGPEAGFVYAVEHDLTATFVVRTSDGLIERSTPAFAALVLP